MVPPPSSEDEASAPVLTTSKDSVFLAEGAARPFCVVDRSVSLERAKADLSCALLITVGGVRPVVSAQEVLDEVARKFDIDPSSMEILKATSEDFLLLPYLRAADRVFNRGLPLCGPVFTLFFKWWTQFALASGAVQPSTVEVEL
jgi:hypothetical protein